MGNEHVENNEDLLVDNPRKSSKQKKGHPLSRQAAIQSLLNEIEQAEKVVNRLLKVVEEKICYLAYLAKTSECPKDTYDNYLCIRIRLMMLQSLFSYMESTARQLYDSF